MNRHAVQPGAPRRLLARLLDTPHLAEIVRRLEPQLLHQLVLQCGLEDCGEILALATTEQLARVFDHDLWTSGRAGTPEEFDADRFALWLEVLAELGPEAAAGKLAEMDFDFVAAAISRLALVFDHELAILRGAAAELGSEYENLDLDALTGAALGRPGHELGGYAIVARRSESWDALLSVLASLDRDHPHFFARLMRRCARLSTEYIVDNGGLHDVLTSDEQLVADIAAAREDRREAEGYVTASQATAFLELARAPCSGGAAPVADPVTTSYFRELAARTEARRGPSDPGGVAPPADPLEQEIRAFLASVGEPAASRGTFQRSLPSGADDRLSHVRRHLLRVQEQDDAAYGRCTEELAYLANVLVSGCSFRSRRFRPVEAADAVLAVCNLGLESGADTPSLVGCFRQGWHLLHEEVCLFSARRLAETLSSVRCPDGLTARQASDTARRLRRDADSGEPWRSRDEIEVVAILDSPSWTVLVNLLDQCPSVPREFESDHGGKPRLRVSTDFEFISATRQIEAVRRFIAALPAALGPGEAPWAGRRSAPGRPGGPAAGGRRSRG